MIDLYTAATMNGPRAALALAECGLPHRFHQFDLQKEDQRKPDFAQHVQVAAISKSRFAPYRP